MLDVLKVQLRPLRLKQHTTLIRVAATAAGLCAALRQKLSCSTPSAPDKLHRAVALGLSSFSPGTALPPATSQKSR